MDEPPEACSTNSSPLSSLSPSPEPETRPTKRPRLSTPPTLDQHLILAKHRSPAVEDSSSPREDLNALLEGLDEQEFDMPPSSDPVVRREDGDWDESIVEEAEAEGKLVNGTVDTDGKRVADDSGIGLLVSDRSVATRSNPLPKPPEQRQGEGKDDEFDGDDMWLGYDDSEMGFDQPDTFPSSVLSLAPPSLDRNEGQDRPDSKGEDQDHHEQACEPPALESFGFSNRSGPGGFVFATRKSFAPSAAALKRAQALFAQDDDAAIDQNSSNSLDTPLPDRPSTVQPLLHDPPSDSATPIPTARFLPPAPPLASHSSMPQVRQLSANAPRAGPPLLAPQPIRPVSDVPPVLLGFQNAAGRSLALPSEAALLLARRKLEKSSSPDRTPAAKSRPPSNAPSRVPSRTGGDDPFDATEGRAPLDTFALPPIETRPKSSTPNGVRIDPFDSPSIPRTRSFVQSETLEVNSGQRRSPLLPVENVQASIAIEKDVGTSLVPSSPRSEPSTIVPDVPTSPFPDAPAATSFTVPSVPPPRPPLVPTRPAFVPAGDTPVRRQLPFRSPLITSARQVARPNSSTPLRPSSLSTSSTAYPVASGSGSTPLFNRRLNLGMTPRNKPFHLVNTQTSSSTGGKGKVKGFVTPFRGGKRPEGLTPMGVKEKTEAAIASAAGPRTSVSSVPTSVKQKKEKEPGRPETKRETAKVFELSSNGAQRLNLVDFGMRPQTHYYEYLESLQFPEEVLVMDSVTSASYVFPCGRSARDAFLALQALVASRAPDEAELVTLPWIKNHWSLIVWKLACYVRSRPDLRESWWNFEMVMDQLRYRYEREINRAERSAIKRIQERDSPASLPLVLCVSQIRWGDPPEDIDGVDTPLTIIGIELTDGWYRIRANVDGTLKRACERGKIVVGAKLAITGAKIDSSTSEGIDVIEALSRSTLVISGNSTSLAPWHSTLGFQPTLYIASFDSLTAAGGTIPLIDIVVDKIYPCGYMDLRRGRSSETWGEEEERVRAEEWQRGRKRIQAKLSADAEKEGATDEDEIVAMLEEAVQSGGYAGTSSSQRSDSGAPEEPDEVLDRLEDAPNKRSIIRQLPFRLLQGCLALAVENAAQSRRRAVEDLRQELVEKYPPREVRSFRLVRVRDARGGSNGPSSREALLTVWDAQSFDTDFFREGRRYLVTNTVPKGSWQRSHKEISLGTRRDSKWSRIEK